MTNRDNRQHQPELAAMITTVFNREMDRSRGIILQANTRAGAVAQFMAAVAGAAGIIVVVVLPRPDVHFTPTSTSYAYVAATLFLVMVLSLAVIMWPRKLRNLPRDKSLADYIWRIEDEAREELESGTPSDRQVSEGYALQGIGWLKDRATQVGLAATVLFTLVFALTFFSLSYQ